MRRIVIEVVTSDVVNAENIALGVLSVLRGGPVDTMIDVHICPTEQYEEDYVKAALKEKKRLEQK